MNAGLSLACVLVAALSLPPAAGAQDRRDVRVSEEVADQVNRYAQFTVFDDISAAVEGGIVTVTGNVTMPYKKKEIEKRIAAIDGVREVRSTIEVLPVSTFDEDLRRRIARAIYGNPSFWSYASMARPSIHIIVKHGRVTLTGVVNSHVDRMLARSLATGFGELSVTNDLRTDDEVRSAQRASIY